ncbi:MAG: hypothetical protein MUQ30_16835 [Anaerolineae bacterium]|nr:hypothetical protein [Anaerolineae bacterium]
MSNLINTYNEGSLHAALKLRYAGDDGDLEVPVDGYIVDVVRDGLLIEVQTASFSSIKSKLSALVESHRVLLVHPVPQRTWIVKAPKPDGPIGTSGSKPSRRISPKRGSVLTLFDELISFPTLMAHPNFSIDVVLTLEDQLRHHDRRRAWRRKGWVIDDRVLLEVVETQRFSEPADFIPLLPGDLPPQFTTADVARALRLPRRLAQRMAYCLRELDLIHEVSRSRRGVVYRRGDNKE